MKNNTAPKIAMIGLGLIGSSLSLNLKAACPQCQLIGYDRHQASAEFALQTKLIDQMAPTFEAAVCEAEIIFLCTPVKTALAQLAELRNLPLKSDVLITDVGSTKLEITQAAQAYGLTNFIGGHPMAGSHKSGVTAADSRLFENAYYILTPSATIPAEKVAELKELLKATQAKIVVLTASEHDQITGMLSHLPHIIAAALVNQSHEFSQVHPRAQQLAAGGFRDLTRIASSDPQMWTDILLSNQETLLTLIDQWQQEMTQIKQQIEQKDAAAIYQFFATARETRNEMPIHNKGAIPAFYDLFVNVPDVPGVIGEVTSLLGKEKLSLINLKILETREDVYGILQLTFKRPEDLTKAKHCLEQQTTYECVIK